MEQLLLLIFLPLAGAIITALAGKSAKIVSTVFAVASLVLALVVACNFIPDASTQFEVNLPWIADLGINFHAGIDGISLLVVLLTNLLVPVN